MRISGTLNFAVVITMFWRMSDCVIHCFLGLKVIFELLCSFKFHNMPLIVLNILRINFHSFLLFISSSELLKESFMES